jgi:hypothetical protein
VGGYRRRGGGVYNSWRTALALEGNWIQKGGEGARLDYIELPLTLGAVS